MAVRIVDAPIKEFYGEQLTVNANNGNRLAYAIRRGFKEVLIEPQAALRLNFVPAIREVWFYDASRASGSQWVNLLGDAGDIINRQVDGDTGTVLDSMQTTDFLYIGVIDRIAGVYIDMDSSAVNGNSSTATLEYSTPTGFVSSANTDNSASGGATLAQDGDITFDSVPAESAWTSQNLAAVLDDTTAPSDKLYWMRYSVGSALSSDVEIEQLVPLHHTAMGGAAGTAGGGLFKASTEYTIDISDHVGAIEVLAQAGSGTNINVTWIRR